MTSGFGKVMGWSALALALNGCADTAGGSDMRSSTQREPGSAAIRLRWPTWATRDEAGRGRVCWWSVIP